jgi:hypothetical protein
MKWDRKADTVTLLAVVPGCPSQGSVTS